MRRPEDIYAAIEAGTDALGFICYPPSKRYVDIKLLSSHLVKLPPFVQLVAVFVNPTVDDVHYVLEHAPVNMLQFHGNETPEFCTQFKKPYFKAIAAVNSAMIKAISNEHFAATAIMLDTPVAGSSGGSGLSFDWRLIPDDLAKPVIIAGGLNATNITDLLKQYSSTITVMW